MTSAGGVELTGVSLFFRQGPLGWGLHIPLVPGTTALYGLNGAGKTRVLQAVSWALNGIQPRDADGDPDGHVDLHVRVTPPHGWCDSLAKTVREAYARRQGHNLYLGLPDPVSFEMALRRGGDLIDDRTLSGAAQGLLDLLRPEWPEDLRPVYERAGTALSRGGHWTLRASGTAEAPRWSAAPALPLGADDAWDQAMQEAVQDITAGLEDEDSRRMERAVALFGKELTLPYLIGLSPARTLVRRPGDMPEWVPIPAGDPVTVEAPPVRVLGSDERDSDVDDETLQLLLVPYHDGTLLGGDPNIDDAVPASAAREQRRNTVVVRVNELMQRLLPEPPPLQFLLPDEDSLLRGERPRWVAAYREVRRQRSGVDQVDEVLVPLAELSAAQRRWAELAIGIATAPADEVPVVFLCDEPESGLHRTAETQLSRGLVELTDRTGLLTVVATHSPRLLGTPGVTPVKVHRGADEPARLASIGFWLGSLLDDERSALEMGLNAGDLLDLMRLAVVVEGEHDRAVFDTLLGTTLGDTRAGLLPIRGAAKDLSALVNAQLLWRGTDSKVLVVLDNATGLDEVWSRAKTLAAGGKADEARAALLEDKRRARTPEARWLIELGMAALETGRLERLHCFGMSEPDVVCYLPAHMLLNKGLDWTAAVTSWKEAAEAAEPPGKRQGPQDLKGWLIRANMTRGSFEDDRIRGAAEHLREELRRGQAVLHPDLQVLAELIRDLSGSP